MQFAKQGIIDQLYLMQNLKQHLILNLKQMASYRVSKIQFRAIKMVALIRLRSHEVFIENYL